MLVFALVFIAPVRVLDLPEPVQGPARRRQLLRRPRQLQPGPRRPAVLGVARPGRAVPRRAGADHAGASPCSSRSPSTARRLHGPASSASRSSCRTRCPPSSRPSCGASCTAPGSAWSATSTTSSASRCPTRCRTQLGARVDRQHRHLGVRRLQHADLLLRAARRSPPTSTRPPRSTAPAQFRIIRSIKLPALRPAIVIATIFSIIGSFQLFNEPSILRPLAPERDHHVLHAEHVRLQPVVLGPAVQLLGHDRDHHGRHHRRSSPTSCSSRLAEGGLT